MVSTFGIEEEFLLIDPLTGFPTGSQQVMRTLTAAVRPNFNSSVELLEAQVESSTPVCTSTDEALDSLLEFRSLLASASSTAGVRVAATGAAPLIPDTPPSLTATDRYRKMGQLTGGVAREQYVNGTHIHVGIPTRDAGIHVLNGLRPWLALLGAVAANSPYWRGQDTGFASWRMVHYRRWSVQGCPPVFADAADYDRRLQGLLQTDVVLDAGHVGWAARLSESYPTVEVRIADAQLEAGDSVLLAALVRGLVSTLAAGEEPPPPDPELLDVGLWQAARFGLGANLVAHPGGSAPAAGRLAALLDFVSPALDEAGDTDFVADGIRRILGGHSGSAAGSGTGAERQRRAVRQGGETALADLFSRSLALEA